MNMLRAVCMGAMLACATALAVPAQEAGTRERTLADIRQELSVLFVEIQKLKRELSTTGAPAVPVEGGSVIGRVNAIEQELQRLTASTEELEFRIESVVRDGTNRIGDLEFRLLELEGGDLSTLGQTPPLGGAAALDDTAQAGQPPAAGPELAVGEQARFDAARAALDADNPEEAARLFSSYLNDYPGGALIGQAHFWRGEALTRQGESAPAARAYLDSFSADPDAPTAPRALFSLGQRLADLDQMAEACVTLGEVQARFPDSDVAFDAGAERRRLDCQ